MGSPWPLWNKDTQVMQVDAVFGSAFRHSQHVAARCECRLESRRRLKPGLLQLCSMKAQQILVPHANLRLLQLEVGRLPPRRR